MTNEELNAKVAEARGELIKRSERADYHDLWSHGFDKIGTSPKPYATDMNCAMELVEEMRTESESAFVSLFTTQTTNSCEVGHMEDIQTIEVEAATMPRAVCKAYLEFK